MCGIAGIICRKNSGIEIDNELLAQMGNVMIHRGPDDHGIWINDQRDVGFVHRRLSILDLSPYGRQPMHDHASGLTIIFNGEIYNHLDLRKQLDGSYNIDWLGNSDTETILHCFANWGIKKTLRCLVGMFAIALYDNKINKLYIIKDRFGEKPLYFCVGPDSNYLIFGSDLASFRKFNYFDTTLDRGAISLFLRYNYIPYPYTIYKNARKLKQGSIAELSLDSMQLNISSYWSADDVIQSSSNKIFKGDRKEASDELELLIKNAVQGQLISDVPLGAFLSGGIDSSTVVSVMQSLSASPVKTFSIGFKEDTFNESKYAIEIADYLKTDHTQYIITDKEAQRIIPDLHNIYTEPFADSSQIPTILVSQLAKQKVTVALSGDGGDEIFGGYNRHLYAGQVLNKLKYIPNPLKRFINSLIHKADPSTWNKILPPFGISNIGEKLYKISDLIGETVPIQFYMKLLSHFDDPSEFVLNGYEPKTTLTGLEDHEAISKLGFTEQMMAYDSIAYLADDILVKVDRGAMSKSLESRIPFLDHRIFEFAWSLPLDYKVNHREGKLILKDVLYRHIPQRFFNRPKMGFAIPLSDWLRTTLKNWSLDTLSESSIKKAGILDYEKVSKILHDHMTKKSDNGHKLWCMLMLQSWLNANEK